MHLCFHLVAAQLFSYFALGLNSLCALTGSDLGKLAESYMKKGDFVPDEVTCDLMLDSIRSVTGNVLLDGFPRTVPQAQIVDAAIDIDMVLHLNVPGWLG